MLLTLWFIDICKLFVLSVILLNLLINFKFKLQSYSKYNLDAFIQYFYFIVFASKNKFLFYHRTTFLTFLSLKVISSNIIVTYILYTPTSQSSFYLQLFIIFLSSTPQVIILLDTTLLSKLQLIKLSII